MKKEEKLKSIEELKEKFSSYSSFYITDALGLTVGQVNNLRMECYDNDVEYKVVKNTLAIKALEATEGEFEPLYEALKGPTSLFFSNVANTPGKILVKYRKGQEKPILKAAFIAGAMYFGDNEIDNLSKLKSKEELIGEIITLLQSPMSNVIGALESGKNTIAGVVKTLSEREDA
jgi:large subunit ribosomal protein L10